MGKICSSEESQFCRADGAFSYLQHSFFSECYEKSFMVERESKFPAFWCCTDNTVSSSTKLAGKVLQILFTAQDGTAQLGHVYQTPAQMNKLLIGNYVSESQSRKVQRNNYLTGN